MFTRIRGALAILIYKAWNLIDHQHEGDILDDLESNMVQIVMGHHGTDRLLVLRKQREVLLEALINIRLRNG